MLGVGGTLTLTIRRASGTPDIAKVTLLSASYSAQPGPAGGTPPNEGGYLILSVRVACVAGLCSPDAGRWAFHTPDGRDYFSIGPGATGYEPALGYDAPFGTGNVPLNPGQQTMGLVGIDSPHVAGIVYLVGADADTVASGTAPDLDLNPVVGGWSLAG